MSTEIAIDAETRTQATAIEQYARDLTIATPDDYADAGEWLKTLKSYREKVEEKFGFAAAAAAAHKAWKKIVALRDEVYTPADNAEALVKRKMAQWSAEEERKRQDAQRKAEEAARKEAERAAKKLEKKGDIEGAEAARATPAPVVVQTTVPKVAGVTTRKLWKFRITDPNAIPRDYLLPDEEKIGKVVRALKEQTTIPGIQVYSEDSIAAGRG